VCLFFVGEKPVKFVSPPKEADGSVGLGAIVMGCIGALIIAVIVSDAPYLLQAIKGKKMAKVQQLKGISKFPRRK
jgi:hypothetical protein